MKKIKYLFLTVFMVFCFTACGKKPEHYSLEAKTLSFESLEDMESFSGAIVRGTRQKGAETIVKKENGEMISGYTFSDFEISEVYKDTTNTLEKGSIITVLENEVFDEEENIIYHIAGYNMMVPGKEYLLFLKRNTLDGQDYYVAAGVNFGTISLEEDNRMTERRSKNGTIDTDLHYFEPIWDAAKEKYIP